VKSQFNVSVDQDAVERARMYLQGMPGGLQKAFSLAANRAIDRGKTAAAKAVTQDYTIRSSDVKRTFRIQKFTPNSATGEIVSKGRRIPLMKFRHRPAGVAETTGSGQRQIRVEAQRGKPKVLPRGFKHKGQIFTRVGPGRYPIVHLKEISVPEMLSEDGRHEMVEQVIAETLSERLDHETKRLMEKKRSG